ncbi:hypothetical protein KGA66_05910 [Actinocrinis puniceicyclus]|uniref:Esterase n=1 Tax=Actinocrinis puniceicyclus TaxID=977794 RepID=A0A8J8BAZ3_9ACTN|nr:hypothetical protein [Actinocrinis puniceicyclus]MBS2962573.1 hypothetical protein [Actinocrinis puniceicyclus]
MGITGKLFLVTLGLAALAACGLTLWLWPRLARPGARPVAGRIGLMLAAQLTAALAVAALANDLFGFYTSWSDLFGVAPQRYQLKDSGGVQPGVNASQLHGGTTATAAPGTSHAPGKAAGDTLVTTTLVGLRSGITTRLQVFLPPQYFAPADTRRYYPAIVVDESADPGVSTLSSELMSSAAQPGAVVVIVRGDGHHPIPCVNQADAPTGELFWGQDLRTAVADAYRVRLEPAAWGALSSGSGNACALSLAVEDAGRYSAAAVFGPWRAPGSPATTGGPAWWLRNYPAPPSRLLLAASGASSQAILGPVRPPLQVTSTTGPTSEYAALDWLARTLANGAPQS